MAADEIKNKAEKRARALSGALSGLPDVKASVLSQIQIPDKAHAALTVTKFSGTLGEATVLFAFDDFVLTTVTEDEEQRHTPMYTMGPSVISTTGGSGKLYGTGKYAPRLFTYSGALVIKDSFDKTFSRWIDAWDSYFSSTVTAAPQDGTDRYITELRYLNKRIQGHVISMQLGAEARTLHSASFTMDMMVTDVRN